MDEVTVALDGMGGDDAPAAPVAGALEVAREGVGVLLVGDEATLTAELARQGGVGAGIEVVHAPDVVSSQEEGARAVRAKPEASVSLAARLVGDGRAGAVVSAGNTGATLAAATLHMRRIPGVIRPAIAVALPAAGGRPVRAARRRRERRGAGRALPPAGPDGPALRPRRAGHRRAHASGSCRSARRR